MRTHWISVAVLLLAGTAHATVLTFDSRAAFEGATGAIFAGSIPMSASAIQFSIGDLHFLNAGGGSSLNASINWSTEIDEAFDLAINGPENFIVESGTPLYSFGFDFHEPTASGPGLVDTCNFPCTPSTFEIRLFSGVMPIAVHEFTRPKDSLQFVGIWTSSSFDRIEIHETMGTADNEFFGNFTTGVTPAPEPVTLALFGIGLGALFSTTRRHQ